MFKLVMPSGDICIPLGFKGELRFDLLLLFLTELFYYNLYCSLISVPIFYSNFEMMELNILFEFSVI